jgi:hypothetical protein
MEYRLLGRSGFKVPVFSHQDLIRNGIKQVSRKEIRFL